jgi:hypothetical protein
MVKHCPFKYAGWIADGDGDIDHNREHRNCDGADCAVWDKTRQQCGLIHM